MLKRALVAVTSALALLAHVAVSTAAAPAAQAATCSSVTLSFRSSGTCVVKAQSLLKKYGFYTATVDGKMGRYTVNAVLNYQRAQRIYDSGSVDPTTWGRLLRTTQVPTYRGIPASCKVAGTVLCASKAQRKLFYLRNGVIKKTVAVRFGGMTVDDYGNLKIYRSVNGTYNVWGKDANAYSQRWQTVMPYSIKFHPGMYVHYSPDFARWGYLHASHGCVNVRTMSEAAWLFNNTPLGTRVVVY